MILALYGLGTLAYLLVGAIVARYVNNSSHWKEFKDNPRHVGFLALIWPLVLFLSIVLILVPSLLSAFGKFILGGSRSSL